MQWQPQTPETFTGPGLERDHVHVWCWSFTRRTNPKRDDAVLSNEERLHLRKLRFEPEQKQYLVSHANVRHILGSYLQLPPDQLRFTSGAFGKPSMQEQDAQRITFNLAHSHSVGLLAVGLEMQLGIDVEDCRSIDRDLCRAFFSSSEQTQMNDLSSAEWLSGFYNCWTRKEAILKAEGSGLSVSLDSFDVSLRPHTAAELLEYRSASNLTRHWKLHHLEPGSGVIGALATERPAKVQHFEFDDGEL